MRIWVLVVGLLLTGVAWAEGGVEFVGELKNGGIAFTGLVDITVRAYGDKDDDEAL